MGNIYQNSEGWEGASSLHWWRKSLLRNHACLKGVGIEHLRKKVRTVRFYNEQEEGGRDTGKRKENRWRQSSPEQGNGQWQIADPRSGVRQTWMGILSCHALPVCLWANFLRSLSFSLSIWTMGYVVVVVHLFSHVQLFATPWTSARQVSLSITNSWSLLILMSIESVMPSNHLILCCPLLQPSIFPSITVFSSESILRIRWQNIGALASASVLLMNVQGWFPLGLMGLISLQYKGLSRVFSNITVQKHQFYGAQLSL